MTEEKLQQIIKKIEFLEDRIYYINHLIKKH